MKCVNRTEYHYEDVESLEDLSARMTTLDEEGWTLADPVENETDDEKITPRSWRIAGEREVCLCRARRATK